MARICWGRKKICWGRKKKHYVAKVLLAIWELFLRKYNRSYNSYKINDKFAFILFLSFFTNQKQKSSFQQVGGLVMKIISVFCLYRIALYFKAISNSINFYRGIFLHVIPVRIIVPWLNVSFLKAGDKKLYILVSILQSLAKLSNILDFSYWKKRNIFFFHYGFLIQV